MNVQWHYKGPSRQRTRERKGKDNKKAGITGKYYLHALGYNLLLLKIKEIAYEEFCLIVKYTQSIAYWHYFDIGKQKEKGVP